MKHYTIKPVEPIPEPMTAYLIDVENEAAGPVEISNSLEGFYAALHCDMIEIIERGIGGIRKHPRYTIVCDEEGLLRDDPKISAIDDLGRAQLVGSLLICKTDPDDPSELAGLTQKDVRYIAQYVQRMSTRKRPRPYPMLCQLWD